MRLLFNHFCLVYFLSLLITKDNDFLNSSFPCSCGIVLDCTLIRGFLEFKRSLKIIRKYVFLPLSISNKSLTTHSSFNFRTFHTSSMLLRPLS